MRTNIEDSIMADDENIIETVDEEGNPIKFQLFDIIEYNDQEYAMLLPYDEEDEDDDPEIVLMKLVADGDDEYSFETIDDEKEFEAVAEYIANIEDEVEE